MEYPDGKMEIVTPSHKLKEFVIEKCRYTCSFLKLLQPLPEIIVLVVLAAPRLL